MIRNPGSVSHRDRIRRIDRRLEHGDQLMIEVKDAIRDFRKELREQHELNREQHELNRREHELNRASAERLDAKHARTQKEVEQEMRNSRTVTREVIAEMRQLREESRRHFEASNGALVDLAAEIRSWGGGTAPAA